MPAGVRWRDRLAASWPLGYLAILCFQAAFAPRWWSWPLVVAVVALFVPFYLLAVRAPGPLRRWAAVATTVLGCLVVPFNSGGAIFFVYAAGFAGSFMSRQRALGWYVGLSVLLAVGFFVSDVPYLYRAFTFGSSLVFVWVVGLVSASEASMIRDATALRMEHARVEHLATLTERERISRDLHDLLGQTLTGIVVRSQLAQKLTAVDTAAGVAEMAEIERSARAALAEVRATVSGWRHVSLDDELQVARDALAAAGVTVVVDRDEAVLLTPSAETALSLAVREAVTNVVRHAHATRCTVALRIVDDQVVLEVADDGIGGKSGRGAEGNGLTGMRERIAALGGKVERTVRDGTVLTVAVPAMVAT